MGVAIDLVVSCSSLENEYAVLVGAWRVADLLLAVVKQVAVLDLCATDQLLLIFPVMLNNIGDLITSLELK